MVRFFIDIEESKTVWVVTHGLGNTDHLKVLSIRIQSDYFTRKKNFTERKRALRYIHLHTLYVGFMVRVGHKLRCLSWVRVRIRYLNIK